MKNLILLLILAINLMASSEREDLYEFIKNSATSINYEDISDSNFDISDLDSIIEVSFLDENITTLPSSIYLLSELVSLNLSGTKIKTLPNELTKIKSLSNLYLSNMELFQIPTLVFEMSQLTYLDISHNNLEQLPQEIFNLENLDVLSLNDNKLYTLPMNFFNLFLDKDEIFIDISNNKLTFLDKSMCNIKEFIEFNFHGNFFDELPSCIKNYKDEEFMISSTDIYGWEEYSINIETLKEMGWRVGEVANINYSNESDKRVKFEVIFGEDVNVSKYYWKFGDESNSNEKNPIHEYLNFGEFNVTLSLNGGEIKTSKIINIRERVLELKKGWNLISTPTIEDINASIFESAWGYQNGEWIEPKYLKPFNGYFVKLKYGLEYKYKKSSYKLKEFNLYRYIWYLLGSGEKLSEFSENYIRYIYKDNEWVLNPNEIETGQGFWINFGNFNEKEEFAYFLNYNTILTDINGEKMVATKDNLKDIKELEFYGFGLLMTSANEELPPEIKYLTSLEKLSIASSNMKELPKEVYNLTTLKSLNIYTLSKFTISKEIENLENLEEFELVLNEESLIPNEVFKLKNLKRLSIIDANLSELPKEIGELKKLEYLNLTFNNLESLPSEIANLKSLKYLNFSINKIKKIPKAIFELKNLETLDFYENNISNLSESNFNNLVNLKKLILDNNNITTFPSIDKLVNLEDLSLSQNHIKTIPSYIGNFKDLTDLSLYENEIVTLPSEIGELTKLEKLYLNGNNLIELPKEIGNLKNLEKLYLDNNRLSSLPKEIEGLTNLKSLSLSNNQLTTLPKEVLNLENLRWIMLDNNPIEELPNGVEDLIVTLPYLQGRKK